MKECNFHDNENESVEYLYVEYAKSESDSEAPNLNNERLMKSSPNGN